MEIEYVKKIVEPILAAGGLFLADLKISRDNVIEVYVDKNVGKPVEAKLKDGRKIEGVLKAFDAETVTIEREERQAVPGSKKKQTVQIEERIRREELKEIKDVVRW